MSTANYLTPFKDETSNRLFTSYIVYQPDMYYVYVLYVLRILQTAINDSILKAGLLT